MVACAAGRTYTAARQAFDDGVVGHFQVYNLINLHAHLFQSLGLRHCAWHTVKDEAAGAIWLRKTLFDDADDHVIGDERARLDEGFRLQAHLRFVLHRFTKDIARADGGDIQLVADNFRLRAFARAGRAQKDQFHCLVPLT